MVSIERAIRELTQPIDGQYPRPWMTKLAAPESAKVFIVGKNQAKEYPVEEVGSHSRYLDALFNRNGQTCRGLYDRISGGQPSPTRKNTDSLTTRLERAGVSEVLETNVICYSTPMSSHLSLPVHRGGRDRGREVFRTLLYLVRPSVLVVHGAGAARELGKVIEVELPEAADADGPPVMKQTAERTVFVLPSLAPPAYNLWSRWAPNHLDQVARAAAQVVR